MQDDVGGHEVRSGPVHHGFVPHGNDFDNVRKFLGQRHRAFDFVFVRLEILLGVVGMVGPRTLAIDPRPEHHVHLKSRVGLFQL